MQRSLNRQTVIPTPRKKATVYTPTEEDRKKRSEQLFKGKQDRKEEWLESLVKSKKASK